MSVQPNTSGVPQVAGPEAVPGWTPEEAPAHFLDGWRQAALGEQLQHVAGIVSRLRAQTQPACLELSSSNVTTLQVTALSAATGRLRESHCSRGHHCWGQRRALAGVRCVQAATAHRRSLGCVEKLCLQDTDIQKHHPGLVLKYYLCIKSWTIPVPLVQLGQQQAQGCSQWPPWAASLPAAPTSCWLETEKRKRGVTLCPSALVHPCNVLSDVGVPKLSLGEDGGISSVQSG